MDTPELNDPRTGIECFANQAAAQAHTVLDAQTVYLESDPTQAVADRYGRTLAYVWTTTGRLFNLDMISDGFAHEYTYDKPYHYQDAFRAAEAEARRQARGLWNPSACPT
jgi:micrococcal nuclease